MKSDESLDENIDEFWSAFRQIRYARERKKERKNVHPSIVDESSSALSFRRRRRQKRQRRRRRRTSDGDGEGALLLLLLLFFFSSFSVASFSMVEIY
jgi:hypothetical protein